MKRLFAIVLLVASTAQVFSVPVDSEKELKDTRYNIGSRVMCSGRALIAGLLAFEIAKEILIPVADIVYLAYSRDKTLGGKVNNFLVGRGFKEDVAEVPTSIKAFIAGSAVVCCFLTRQAWRDADYALNNE